MTAEKRNRKNSWQRALQISHIAFLIPAGIFVGYALGYYLDKVFETTFIRIIGLLVGIVAGFIEMIREIERSSRD